MNTQLVSYILSRLAFALVGCLSLPLLEMLYYGERGMGAFAWSMLIAFIVACYLRGSGIVDNNDSLSIREGVAITGLGWILITVLGMLPYLFGGYLNILDSLFESISGFTGTGATVFESLDNLPYGLLFWRMMTHWIGGLGIIVIFIAILPQSGASTIYMYNAEGMGPTDERVLPRIRDMSMVLFKIYLFFTIIITLTYMLCGLSFDIALAHAMSTAGAGGFSTFDASVRHFDNVFFEIWMSFFMFLAGGNFLLYYRAWQKGIHVIWENLEFRSYLKIQLMAIIIIAIGLILSMDIYPLQAFREAVFQVISLSTTGFVSANFEIWPSFTKWVLLTLMLIGGCAGSAASGIKVSRILIIIKGTLLIINRRLRNNRVTDLSLSGNSISEEMLWRVGQFFVLYILIIMVTALLLTADGVFVFDAVAIAISTMGNIGPAFGIAGATSTYATLSAFSKAILSFTMLLGRLEIFTLLVLFRPEFWRRTRRW